MSLRVLDAADAAERSRWCELLQQWPDREVFADPAYVELFATPGERVLACCWDAPTCHVLMPLILRPLRALDWVERDCALWDATSAYGYAGPFAWGDVETARRDFWPALDAWARAQNIVCLFSRLSLFEEQLALPASDVHHVQLNVVRSLDLDDDALWMDYAHKVRKNVQRAERDGVHIELDLDGRRLDDFCRIYTETMHRRKAAAGYYFDQAFFERIVERLPGQYALFHALREDKVVSTELVLVSAAHVYSFLGGTLAETFAHRPNDLLKHHVIRWARDKGKKYFVLGGGYGSDDGIFLFKKSFAPAGVRSFSVLRRVLDSSRNDELVEQRSFHARQVGQNWVPRAGYFPAYRS